MSISRVHSRYAMKIRVDGQEADAKIGGITRQQVRSASEVRRERTSGSVVPQFVGLYAQKPIASGATYAIASLLAQLGVTGLPITSSVNPGVVLYAQKFAENSTPASGGAHRSYTLKSGILVPRTLRVSHQGDATLDYEALVTYDGSNSPIVITDSVSLPTGITDAERFTLGPMTVAGVSLPQVTELQIDFGVQARTIGADSDVWDTFAWIAGLEPMITLTGIDVEWLKSTNLPLTGEVPTHADTEVWLRKRSQDGDSFVDETDAEHVKFSMAGIAVVQTAFDQSGDEPASCSVEITGVFDGTNMPLVVDTSAAIST